MKEKNWFFFPKRCSSAPSQLSFFQLLSSLAESRNILYFPDISINFEEIVIRLNVGISYNRKRKRLTYFTKFWNIFVRCSFKFCQLDGNCWGTPFRGTAREVLFFMKQYFLNKNLISSPQSLLTYPFPSLIFIWTFCIEHIFLFIFFQISVLLNLHSI